MPATSATNCLARFVLDDEEIALANLHAAMEQIQQALHDLPVEQQPAIGHALLSLAIFHVLRDSGAQLTATALIRLADLVLEDEQTRAAADAPSNTVFS